MKTKKTYIFVHIVWKINLQTTMTTIKLNEKIRRLKNKHSSFRNNAKIHFKHLNFENVDDVIELSSHLNSKNVARLMQIYKFENCLRIEKKHRIVVTIDDKILKKMFRKFALINAQLMQRQKFFELKFDATVILHCLHDKHRVATTKKIFIVDDKWWVVDLYNDD